MSRESERAGEKGLVGGGGGWTEVNTVGRGGGLGERERGRRERQGEDSEAGLGQ